MTRIRGWVAGLAVAAVVAACGDGEESSSGGGVAGGGYYGSSVCAEYTTCGSCTPVTGCGWCFNATGGQCAADPDECAFSSNAEFTWTWNSSGCPSVDASVGRPISSVLDAGVVQHEAGAVPDADADANGAADVTAAAADAASEASTLADDASPEAAEE